MTVEFLPLRLSVCKLENIGDIPSHSLFTFTAVTDGEISVVCPTENKPKNVLEAEDGFTAFRIAGTLDFALTGILAPIADALADAEIGIFALSTFDTDYVLIKEDKKEEAAEVLKNIGYAVRLIDSFVDTD